jgi:DNA invertase Pin-like site-specific DNA recombinase
MLESYHQKITPSHLARKAYLYIRQSTLRQVFENTESTKRQYALKERAIQLGWAPEDIITIDNDLGISGASAIDRDGFQRLVSDVGLGRAGIVMGLEVSRLARNSADWHRLLEICALTGSLILDEDGLYDPNQFNDRLLLGLKGTMSEAELHVLKARLQGGIRAKAKRGELEVPLPIGFIYNTCRKVVLDPDKQVRESIATFFTSFIRTGTATSTVKYFRDNNLKFPRRLKFGPSKGELTWTNLVLHRALQTLHNPRYAGAFFYGRRRRSISTKGKVIYCKKNLPQDKWLVLQKDAHEGYITWDRYEANLAMLKQSSLAYGHDRRRSPPREGPALLQGLAICGICGKRMTLRYHTRKGLLVPDYLCQRDGIEQARTICQIVPGAILDETIGNLLVESITPLALEVALNVQAEVESQTEAADRIKRQHVERARYETDLARRRFMQVDPDNRMVADSLEAEWNSRLKALSEAQETYESERNRKPNVLGEGERESIRQLATDFPSLWHNPKTPDRERKRMVRLLIEDVTIKRGEGVSVGVRFKGGATHTFDLPQPKPAWAMRKTDLQIVKEIDQLLDDHTPSQIAQILNDAGKRSGMGQKFDKNIVQHIKINYRLKSHRNRQLSKGLMSLTDLAAKLKVSTKTIHQWVVDGQLNGIRCSDKNEYLFKMPDQSLVEALRNFRKNGKNGVFLSSLSQSLNEV